MPAENTGGQAVKRQGRKRKPRSGVWNHYEVFTNSEGEYRARCNRCSLDLAADSRHGTSRLHRHIKDNCPQRQYPGSSPPKPLAAAAAAKSQSLCSKPADSEEPAASRKTKESEEAIADLARMIALHSYDPSFVEDSYFRSFVRQLNPDFQVPSRADIEVCCHGIFEETTRVLESELARTSGQVNLALDTTETAQGTVLYVACHFIDEDWNRRQMIFDTYLVAPEYMTVIPAEYMGIMPLLETGGAVAYGTDRHGFLVQRISNHAILDRLFSITIGITGDLKPYLDVARLQAACGGVSSCYGNNTYADIMLYWVAEGLCDSLKSRRFVGNEHLDGMVEGEPGHNQGEIHSQLLFDYRLPYHKKWYSCYCSLQVFEKYSSFESDKLLCRLWREIHRATKRISDPNHPTSNIVLTELFKVRETLQTEIAGASTGHRYSDINCFAGNIAVILEKAKETLEMGIKNSYLKWSIPLVLDPRRKLQFIEFIFNRAFGSSGEVYICKVKEEIKRLFTSFGKYGGDPNHVTEVTAGSAHQLEQAWDVHCRSEVTKTELDRYLEDPRVQTRGTDSFDILNWWKANISNYPTVARMARAALAIPTCHELSSEQMSLIMSKARGYSK